MVINIFDNIIYVDCILWVEMLEKIISLYKNHLNLSKSSIIYVASLKMTCRRIAGLEKNKV